MMPRRKQKKRPMRDDRLPLTAPLVVETMETLSGPGPCERCAAPKFDHRPFGGITHTFVPRHPMARAAQAARNAELKRARR